MNREYKNLIFTEHALERIILRSLSQDQIWQVIDQPKKQFKQQHNTKFIGKIEGRFIHVVAKRLATEQKWLIISVWVRGEEDPIPLSWQLISWPFKAVWWIIKMIWKTGIKRIRNTS